MECLFRCQWGLKLQSTFTSEESDFTADIKREQKKQKKKQPWYI